MATWRRKLLEIFPDKRQEIQRPDFSIYDAFFILLPAAREAHELGDRDTARQIYAFAEWCTSQKSKDLWNAAAVSFYEHLFELTAKILWPDIVRNLSPQIIEELRGLWEQRLSPKDFERLERLLERRTAQVKSEQ